MLTKIKEFRSDAGLTSHEYVIRWAVLPSFAWQGGDASGGGLIVDIDGH
jgi:hypothetical protein